MTFHIWETSYSCVANVFENTIYVLNGTRTNFKTIKSIIQIVKKHIMCGETVAFAFFNIDKEKIRNNKSSKVCGFSTCVFIFYDCTYNFRSAAFEAFKTTKGT